MIRRFKLIWIVIGRPPSLSLSLSHRAVFSGSHQFTVIIMFIFLIHLTRLTKSRVRSIFAEQQFRTPSSVHRHASIITRGEEGNPLRRFVPWQSRRDIFESGVDKNHRKEERKENVSEGRSRMGVEIVTSSRFLRVRLYYVFQRPAPLIHFVKLDLRHPLPSLFTTAPRAVLATFDSRAWRPHRGRESATNSSSIFLRSSVDAIPR